MSGFGSCDFSAIKPAFGAASEAAPAPAVSAAAAVSDAAAAFSFAAAPPVLSASSGSGGGFSFARSMLGPTPLQPKSRPVEPICDFSSNIALRIQRSDVVPLVRALRVASVDQLRSLPEFPVSMASLRTSEQQNPYHTPTRMTREVVTKLREWQLRGTLNDASSSSSLPWSSSAATDPSCANDFHEWLAEFRSSFPRRLAAFCHLAELNGASVMLPDKLPSLLECIPRFGWLDFAEQSNASMQSTSMAFSEPSRVVTSLLFPFLLRPGLVSAVVKRMERLAALERQRIPDPSVQVPDEPASASPDPLSTAAVLSSLFAAITRQPSLHSSCPRLPLLRALLTAATAPALLGSASVSRRLSLSFDGLSRLLQIDLIVALLREFGIDEDGAGRSFTLWLIKAGNTSKLQQWLAPANAHLSMPLGWLGERDPPNDSVSFAAAPPQPHPHMDADTRCDLWTASCELAAQGQPGPQLSLQHAIDWHYATVTPRLRDALSAHLIPDLHAEVMSFLMPPSTLPDPPLPAVPSAALLSVRSWLSSLAPEQTEEAHRLRSLEHALCLDQINAGFVQRAFAAERQQWLASHLPL